MRRGPGRASRLVAGWLAAGTIALVLLPVLPAGVGSVGTPALGSPALAAAPAPREKTESRSIGPAIGSSPFTPSNLSGNWSSLAYPPPGLTAGANSALSPDPDLGGVVLFGGGVANNTSAVHGTWLYKNGTWTDLGAGFASSPPHGRIASALVWDPSAGVLVMFGGRNGSNSFNDTWVLSATNVTNGHGWSNVTAATAPSPREFMASFYDPNTTSVIVYGGVCYRCGGGYSNLTFNDTWSFRAGAWTNVTPTNGIHPPGLYSGSAAWDPDLAEGVLVGGATTARGCGASNETWTYDGNWTAMPTNVTPGNVTQGGMAWYAPGHEMVLFAGVIAGPSGCSLDANSTWVLTGRNWSDLTASSSASSTIGSRFGVGLAYDPFARVVVAFGGALNNTTALGDLWSFPAAPLEASILGGAVAAANDSPDLFRAVIQGGQAPYYYHWTFGDGSPSVGGAGTEHVYTAPGSYLVSLEVVDDAGRTGNATTSVTVVPELELSATSGALQGDAPFYVTFNSSTSGGLPPYHWTWSFGDGFYWNSPNVTHEFMIEGTFHVALNATDALGDNVTVAFTAVVNGRMLASIVPSAYSALTPAPVNFTAVLRGGTSPFTYAWTFEPGASAAGAATSFTFVASGTYNVSLTVTDALGYVAQAVVTLHIYAPMTTTCAAGTPAGVAPFTDSFATTTTGGAPPLYYSWNFGDGSPRVPGQTTHHQYFDPGRYLVEVTVSDQLGEVLNATTSVLVVAPVSAQPTADVVQGPTPLAVAFTTALVGGLAPFTYDWTYGDGGVGSGPNGSHTYYAPGRFTATETVTDALDENVTATIPLFVYVGLTVALTADPASLSLGNVSDLAATVTGGVDPIALSWTGLPPGCLSRNTTTLDCFATDAGSYVVRFWAHDAVGENRSANVTLAVLGPGGCACPAQIASGPTVPLGVLLAVIGGAVAVIAAAAGWVYLRRRRGGAGGSSPEAPP